MAFNRVKSFYSQRAKLYQRFFVNLLQWERVLDSFFQANNYLHSGMKTLDAGCGTGSVTLVLHRLAQRSGFQEVTFHAFDLTPAMLNLFRERMQSENIRDIRLQQADVLDLTDQLPADWKNYDLTVSSAMLEYIPDEKRGLALTNLRSLLNEDGCLLALLTKRTWITQWTGGRWWGTHLFERESFTQELRRAGFTNIQFRQLPGGWDSFMLAVEARK